MSASASSYIDLYKSVPEYQKLLKEYPSKIFPYQSFSSAFARTAQYTKAIEILDEGISNVAKEDKLILKLTKLNLFARKASPDDFNGIKSLVSEIIESSEDPKQKGRAYRTLGEYLTKQKLLDEAKKAYLLAYNAARADHDNLMKIADHFRDNKDFETELYFRTLLNDLKPNDESNLVLLGNCHYVLNQYDLAFQYYDKARKSKDDVGAWVYGNIGNLYVTSGLYSLGAETFQSALKISSDDSYARERIASAITLSKKQLEKSEKTILSIRDSISNKKLTLDDINLTSDDKD